VAGRTWDAAFQQLAHGYDRALGGPARRDGRLPRPDGRTAGAPTPLRPATREAA
jgi:hypothetical protein